MKNILIGVLVVVVLVFGFLSIKGDKEASENVNQIPVGDTEYEKEGSYPSSVTNPPVQNTSQNNNTSNLKLFTRTNYSFKAPKEWIESGPNNFQGCMWDGVSNDTSDGHRQAGEIGIYPKSCFDISNASGYKEMKEISGYYILAYYDSGSGTTSQEEVETKAVYQNIISTFKVNPPAQNGGGKTTITVPLVTENSVGADFGPFGCLSYIKFVEREVPQTQAVLGATYNWLFSNPSSVGAYSNTIATQTNLDFQSVEIVNGTAKVYLTGSIMANHCADATFGAQIEQAAFQYSTVNDIEVYVNGELFDWCDISDAGPSEGNCANSPQLWNYQRFTEN